MTTVWQDDLRLGQHSTDERELTADIAAGLLSDELPTAPHVITRLLRGLNGDVLAVREAAAALSGAHRSGQRMLPSPLPLVPSIEGAFSRVALDADTRAVLLTAALSIDDRVEPLLDACGCTADELLQGGLAEHLTASNGRFALHDPRMGIWLDHTAAPLESVNAHARLERAHREHGNQAAADWHAACGAVTRRPEVARALTTAARELSLLGSMESAFAFATAAAEHADDPQRETARLIAGTSAAAAGCFDDANELLAGLLQSEDAATRIGALPGVLLAQTCARGWVPALEPAELRPQVSDAHHWCAWARTAGLAALMCAERGATPAMRTWLAEVREADARAGAGGEVRDPTAALCWMLTGDADDANPYADGPFSGTMSAALRAAVTGDVDEGLQLMAGTHTSLIDEHDPLVPGFEHSPLVEAYLAVTESLLLFWRGDIEVARERLSTASLSLPVGIPFAGLGATLAQRLDTATLGAPGPLSQALTVTLPDGIRIDGLVDAGLSAYLDGESEQAATDLALWRDRGAPEPALSVAGLEEVGPFVDRVRVEPPESSEARELIHRIRSLPETSWRHAHSEISEACRRLGSSFDRGRVEALLGSTCLLHGDLAAGRRHLRAARRLFDDSGAHAWRDAMDARMSRLHVAQAAASDPMTDPITVIRDDDPLAAGRAAWETLLTQRELEVAMRVAAGGENREIAKALDVSVRTVEVHVGRLFDKLGVRNRVELAVMAHRAGRVF
ncbi:helix-turn-helix transcriptional regulator [Microbacterium sp. KHB019]|uniref:helix-turn-helix transcriptional regulator n=1 Tax=Microbacterium sp. KHB019 TaxID=3129770 RepID=UPI00307991FD